MIYEQCMPTSLPIVVVLGVIPLLCLCLCSFGVHIPKEFDVLVSFFLIIDVR